MALFSSEDINRFAQQGEEHFAHECNCIIDRIALDIRVGTSIYDLPDYAINIRRVTWLGYKIYPLTHRDFKDYILPNSSLGRPREYIYNNVGLNQIKLFPTPSISIAALMGNSSELFKSENILIQCIVEFYRTPDYFDFKIPLFIRRRLLKAYVMKMCYMKEGDGQNIKAAKYWSNKYDGLKELYTQLLDELINRPRKLVANGNGNDITRIARPTLPIDKFGIATGPDGLE